MFALFRTSPATLEDPRGTTAPRSVSVRAVPAVRRAGPEGGAEFCYRTRGSQALTDAMAGHDAANDKVTEGWDGKLKARALWLVPVKGPETGTRMRRVRAPEMDLQQTRNDSRCADFGFLALTSPYFF